mmetsp:Transcript_27963/g.64217  ORF Transcript_27963/g.64217 Transcript_27963/m.64217 type:complete len:535 (+) Transcript_27963:639-2243(+)
MLCRVHVPLELPHLFDRLPRLHIVRIEAQRLSQVFLRLVEIGREHQREPPQLVRLGHVGVTLDHLQSGAEGRVADAKPQLRAHEGELRRGGRGLAQHRREERARQREILSLDSSGALFMPLLQLAHRLQLLLHVVAAAALDGHLELVDSFVEGADLAVRLRQALVRLDHAWVKEQRARAVGNALVILAERDVYGGAVAEELGDGGRLLDGFGVQLERIVVHALLKLGVGGVVHRLRRGERRLRGALHLRQPLALGGGRRLVRGGARHVGGELRVVADPVALRVQRAAHAQPAEHTPRERRGELELSRAVAAVELGGAGGAGGLGGHPVLEACEAEDVLADGEQRRVDEVEADGTGELGGVRLLAFAHVVEADSHREGEKVSGAEVWWGEEGSLGNGGRSGGEKEAEEEEEENEESEEVESEDESEEENDDEEESEEEEPQREFTEEEIEKMRQLRIKEAAEAEADRQWREERRREAEKLGEEGRQQGISKKEQQKQKEEKNKQGTRLRKQGAKSNKFDAEAAGKKANKKNGLLH